MKRVLRSIPLMLAGLIATLSVGLPAAAQKVSVAVFEVRTTGAVATKMRTQSQRQRQALELMLDSMRSSLGVTLNDTRKFDVLAQDDLNLILDAVSAEQITADPLDPALAEEFKKRAIQFAVIVDVELFNDVSKTLRVGNKEAERRDIQVAGTAKIYDLESSQLVEGKKYRGGNKNQGKQLVTGTTGDRATLGDELLIEFADEIGQELAYRVMDVAYPIEVLGSGGGRVMINRGDDGSIAVGERLEAFMREGEPIVDEATGEAFYFEVPIGIIEVTRVMPGRSFAKVIEGEASDFTKGVVCRKLVTDE